MGYRTRLDTFPLVDFHLCSQIGATRQEERGSLSRQGATVDDRGSAGTTASPFQISVTLLLTHLSLFDKIAV